MLGVRIEVHARVALERLPSDCPRPPCAMDRLRKGEHDLVYRCAKRSSEPSSDKRGAKACELRLTPLELIDRIAALVPPPRIQRHRYIGVLSPILVAQGCGSGHGFGSAGSSDTCSTGNGHGCAWGDAAGRSDSNPGRACQAGSARAQALSSAGLGALPTMHFYSEPATRAGNPGFARGSKPVPGRDTAAYAVECLSVAHPVEWPIRQLAVLIDVYAKVLADNLNALVCMDAREDADLITRNRHCNRAYA